MTRIYQAPKINQTPMNQRATRWDEVKGSPAPCPVPKKMVGTELRDDPSTFEYWFNYFWSQAIAVDDLSPGDKGRLCEAFFAVLTGTKGNWILSGSFAALNDMEKLKILRQLMVIGFKRVALEGAVPAAKFGGVKRSVTIDRAVDAGSLFVEKVAVSADPSAARMSLGFRGDGRSYEDIVTQNGFHVRSRSSGQDVYKEYGLNKPWHPFNEPLYANSLFLRKGKDKDNCLHTVISVAAKLFTSLDYPILSDGTLFLPGQTPLPQWTDTEINAALTHRFKVRAVKGSKGQVEQLEHDGRLFIVRLDGSRAFSTEQWQRDVGVTNPCPERAVDSVPLDNILAELSYTRLFFDENKHVTFYDFRVNELRLLPSEQVLKTRFGDGFPAQLRSRVNELVGEAKNNLRDAKLSFEKAKLKAAGGDTTGVVLTPGKCPYCAASFKSNSFLNNHIRLQHPGKDPV